MDEQTGDPRKYETVDERCAACIVNGGPDGKCVEWPFALQLRKGRPCPRVDLDASLVLEAEVLGFARHPDVKQLAGSFFESLAGTMALSDEERLTVLRRVHATLAHPDVITRLHPGPELPEE